MEVADAPPAAESTPAEEASAEDAKASASTRRLPRGINFLKKASPLASRVVQSGDLQGSPAAKRERPAARRGSGSGRASVANFEHTGLSRFVSFLFLICVLFNFMDDQKPKSLVTKILLAALLGGTLFPGPGSCFAMSRFTFILIMKSWSLTEARTSAAEKQSHQFANASLLVSLLALCAACGTGLDTVREWKAYRSSTWTRPSLNLFKGNQMRVFSFFIFVVSSLFFARCTIRLISESATRPEILVDWVCSTPYLIWSGLSGWLGPSKSTSRVKIIHHAFAYIGIVVGLELLVSF